MLSFKEFIKQENINFVKSQSQISESVTVGSMFKKIDMVEVRKEKGEQVFQLDLVTHKDTKMSFEIKTSDLLCHSFINSLKSLGLK